VSRRVRSWLMLGLVVLMINLPLVHSTWTRWQVDRNGSDVTATLVDNDVLGADDDPAYWIAYTLPRDIDPDQLEWAREVDKATYDEAVASGTVTVRVLDGNPVTSRAEGQVVGTAGLVATLVADLLLVAFLWVLWRFGRYGRPEVLRLEALGDVVAGAADPGVDEQDGVVSVTGALTETTDHDVVLDAAGRRVVVVLDGRAVLAAPGERVSVRGRRLT
jgi:hypothetical protein